MTKKAISLFLFVVFTIFETKHAYGQVSIFMDKRGGVYEVPCTVNGLDLEFIFDTGASEVTISLTEALFMIKNGYLSPYDILGESTFQDATGHITAGAIIVLRNVKIGGITLTNIAATVVPSLKAPLLFGQSAIQKLGRYEIEGNRLTIFHAPSNLNLEELDGIREKAYKLTVENNFESANSLYEKLFKTASPSQLTLPDYYYRAFAQYGAAVKGMGSYNKTLESWKIFAEKFPYQPSGFYYIGMCQRAQDTTFKGVAISAFDKYLDMLKPNEIKTDILEIIYSYEAGCYSEQDNNANLDETLKKLLQVNPRSSVAANVYAIRGYKAAKAKDFDKATLYSNKALIINPNNTTALQVLKYVNQMKEHYEKLHQFNEAKNSNF